LHAASPLHAQAAAAPPARKQSFIRRFFSALGPGVITGAADDDP